MSFGIAELGLSIVAGSLTTLSPCVFPILPLVVGGAVQRNRLSPVAMGAGMVVSFALIGLLLGSAGAALGLDSGVIRHAGAVLLMVFGIIMLVPALNARFTQLVSPIAASANQASSQLDGGSLAGAFGLGALLGMVWSPCSGPLLASALTLVASHGGGAAQGSLILGLFGTGAAIPLIAIAYASRAGFARSRTWVLARIDWLKKGFAWLIILLGIAILLGADKWLEGRVTDLLPDSWLLLTSRF